MNVVVFGASGDVGRHVVPELLGRGHAVTAVVRAATAYEAPAGARVVRAEVAGGDSLDVVQGHDAIVSCLGIQRAVVANPWSRLTSPPDLCSATARAITAAARAATSPRGWSIAWRTGARIRGRR